jgi:hypothetical protein
MGAQDFRGQHIAQYSFHSHSVAAYSPGGEKGARATPFVIFEAGDVGVMFPAEFYTEIGEGNSVCFLSVTFGFLDLPNQA